MTMRSNEGAISVSEADRNQQPLQTWVEPDVHVLDIAETAVYPGIGPDGATYADCTVS